MSNTHFESSVSSGVSMPAFNTRAYMDQMMRLATVTVSEKRNNGGDIIARQLHASGDTGIRIVSKKLFVGSYYFPSNSTKTVLEEANVLHDAYGRIIVSDDESHVPNEFCPSYMTGPFSIMIKLITPLGATCKFHHYHGDTLLSDDFVRLGNKKGVLIQDFSQGEYLIILRPGEVISMLANNQIFFLSNIAPTSYVGDSWFPKMGLMISYGNTNAKTKANTLLAHINHMIRVEKAEKILFLRERTGLKLVPGKEL